MTDLSPTHNNPPLRDRLAIDHEELVASLDLILVRADALPEPTDDATLGATADIIKEIAAVAKRADAARVAEKEPFLAGGREVDGFFRKITDAAGQKKAALERAAGAYMRRKADEERRRLVEAERLDREAAAARMREAAALEAQAQAEVDERAREALTGASSRALGDAIEAERAADAAARNVAAKPAEMARTRGETSLATLATFWNFEITDLSAIPLDQLRPYIPRADIEKAIRTHIRIHKDAPIRGVRIFEDTQTRVV